MRYKILFVEDEIILGQLVTDGLRKAGFDVELVKNGVDAMGVYKALAPHLCLLDIMLPGKSGYDVARQIRALDSRVPVIFLSAKVQVTDIVAGFDAGCNDYIRKPFSMDELVVRIHTWLTERHGAAQHATEEYRFGDFRFLPRLQQLTTPAGEIELSFKESMILEVFCSHMNQVVSRNFLMQKVWESESVYTSRSLDVYINKLRKYLAGAPHKILTLKGVGYKFITA